MIRLIAMLVVLLTATSVVADEVVDGAVPTVVEGAAGAMADAAGGAGGVDEPEPAEDSGPGLPDPEDEMGRFVSELFENVMSGDWVGVAALALIGIVWLMRKFLAKSWAFLGTDAGGALLVLVTSILGAVATALAAEKAMTATVLFVGLKVGFTAAGGFTTIKKIGKWALPYIFEKVPFLASIFGKSE